MATLGTLNEGYHKTVGFSGIVGSYNFHVDHAVAVSATSLNGLPVVILRHGKTMADAQSLTAVLSGGTYSIRVFTGGKGTSVRLKVGTTDVPTRVQADVWGSGAVHLNWDDNSASETGYSVERWTRSGWRRGVRVGANATAAVISNLSPGTPVSYRVLAVMGDGQTVTSANSVTATTAPVSTDGWYKVDLSPAARGEAGWSVSKRHDDNSSDAT